MREVITVPRVIRVSLVPDNLVQELRSITNELGVRVCTKISNLSISATPWLCIYHVKTVPER